MEEERRKRQRVISRSNNDGDGNDDVAVKGEGADLSLEKKAKLDGLNPFVDLDADDASSSSSDDDDDDDDSDSNNSNNDSSSGSDSGDSDDSEDSEEEELRRALAEIRRDKEQALKRQEREEEERVLRGNPLMDDLIGAQDNNDEDNELGLDQQWYDDGIFQGQARQRKRDSDNRFINDPRHNDFHHRFLRKYIL
jgi:Cwf15/Cwc15 cell cycle control protein